MVTVRSTYQNAIYLEYSKGHQTSSDRQAAVVGWMRYMGYCSKEDPIHELQKLTRAPSGRRAVGPVL